MVGMEKPVGSYIANKYNIAWITLRSTWDMEFEPCVIQAWERVAEYTPLGLHTETQLLSCSLINSHGDVIHQLDLPQAVIDPVSLWQIRMEAMVRDKT